MARDRNPRLLNSRKNVFPDGSLGSIFASHNDVSTMTVSKSFKMEILFSISAHYLSFPGKENCFAGI